MNCTCAGARAIGGDYELGCPVHDEVAIENRRRVDAVTSGVVQFYGVATEAITIGAQVTVEIDIATGKAVVRTRVA